MIEQPFFDTVYFLNAQDLPAVQNRIQSFRLLKISFSFFQCKRYGRGSVRYRNLIRCSADYRRRRPFSYSRHCNQFRISDRKLCMIRRTAVYRIQHDQTAVVPHICNQISAPVFEFRYAGIPRKKIFFRYGFLLFQ